MQWTVNPGDPRRSARLVLALAVLGIGLLWILRQLEFFAAFSLPVYGAMQRWIDSGERTITNVLLLELPFPRELEEEAIDQLIGSLRAQGSSLIAFNFLPDLSQSFYQRCEDAGDVIFGRTLIRSSAVANSYQLLSKPSGARSFPPDRIGITHIPQPDWGVAFKQHAWSSVAGEVQLGLEALAARYCDAENRLERDYWINFFGRHWQQPLVRMDRVLSGQLADLVKDKVVLIGFAKQPYETGIVTFLNPRVTGDTLSLLEFQGYALNTLISEKVIKPVTPIWALAGLTAGMVGVLQLSQWIPAKHLLATAILMPVGIWGVGWLTLSYLQVWLPVPEWILGVWISLLLGGWYHATKREDSMVRVTSDLTNHLHRFAEREQAYSPRDHWERIRDLVDHQLECQHKAFFEVAADGVTLIELKQNDRLRVTELRSDRLPFLDAVKIGEPTAVTEFFDHPSVDSTSYLMPLTFGGALLGFWACSMQRSVIQETTSIQNTLKDYAIQISEVLYWSQLWSTRQHAANRWFQRVANHSANQHLPVRLEETVGFAQRWLTRFEDIFRADRTAAALYDGFGRVLMVNPAMQHHLKVLALSADGHSAQDLLLALFGEDSSSLSKTMLRCVLRDGDIIERHPPNLDASGRIFSLKMQLLSQAEHDMPIEQGEKALRREGMLVKLVDVTSRAKLSQVKLELLQRVSAQVLNDFMTIESALHLLSKDQLPAAKRARVLHLMQTKLEECVDTLREVQDPLRRELEIDFDERYPLDPRLPIIGALKRARVHAMRRRVSLPDDAALPRFIKFLLASPHQLERILSIILEFLIADSRDGGQVEVDLREVRDGYVSYHMRSHGYGMTPEKLTECLTDEEAEASSELQSIRSSIGVVEGWGGQFQVTTSLSHGFEFIVKLTAVY